MLTTALRAALLVGGLLAGSWAISCAQNVRPAVAPAGYFHTYPIDRNTYAISEPKYWQGNVSYLLLGTRRALLFDTGPGIYSLRAEVLKLTHLPILVIPSHLHFDHVGDIQEFSDVGVIDLPELRAEVRNGKLVESADEFLVSSYTWSFHVSEWLKDGTVIDLGDRSVLLISTPGHTRNSVSLIDRQHKQLFIGDIVNHGVTLIDVPGSDIHQMVNSLHRMQALAVPGSLLYEAHSETPISWEELTQLADGATAIAAGQAHYTQTCLANVPQHRYDVGVFPILLPAESGDAGLLPKFKSATQEIEWIAACK